MALELHGFKTTWLQNYSSRAIEYSMALESRTTWL